MGRRTVVICTDDLTGEEVPESEVKDVPLRFGWDEWMLTLTPDSEAKVRELFTEVVASAPHKDLTPKWAREQQQPGTSLPKEPGSEPVNVTIVPPDNAAVRRWWRDLNAAQLRALALDAPKTDRGRIPEDVMAAFVTAHQPPTAQFSG